MAFYCYIVASRQNGTIYVGSTDSLTVRIGQHKAKAIPGFTAKYGCDRLVWFEAFGTRNEAFWCERRMKEWRRSWKVRLIERENPNWRDLYWETCGIAGPGEVEAFLESLPKGKTGAIVPDHLIHADGSRPSPG